MNWKNIIFTVFIVMFGIYVLKWVNQQWPVPVVGQIIEGV